MVAVEDGAGGAYAFWLDPRRGPGQSDVYGQHLDAGGAPLWQTDGAAIFSGSSPVRTFQACSDGLGGVLVAAVDPRSGENAIYVQHVLADGTQLWVPGGLRLFAGSAQNDIVMAPDGAGGALLEWSDIRAGAASVRVADMTPQGALSPTWPPGGINIDGYTPFSLGEIVPDGAGGAYASYTLSVCVRQFPDLPCSWYSEPQLVRVGAAGVAWIKVYGAAVGSMLRITRGPAGDVYASDNVFGWRSSRLAAGDGNALWVSPTLTNWDGLHVSTGTAGRLLSGRQDSEPFGFGFFAAALESDGSVSPRWVAAGSDVAPSSGVGGMLRIVSDQAGGGYVVGWQDRNAYTDSSNANIIANHVSADGSVATGWSPNGNLVTNTSQGEWSMAACEDGQGGAVVLFERGVDLYAQRLTADAPVPVQASLISVSAQPDAVTLEWSISSLAELAVERRTTTSDWAALGIAVDDGAGHARFNDTSVVAGRRYGYRLRAADRVLGQETWVDIPAGYALALAGARPNPASGRFRIGFSLPDDQPAVLVVTDVTGRRVLTRKLVGLGPGPHALNVESLPAGLYLARIVSGTRSATTRMCVLR